MFLPSILLLWWIESLPFEVLSCQIGYSEMRTHDICLAVWILEVTIGVSYWFTWYMLWHSTRGFPWWYWGNLCIGVDARFSPTETSGSLYSSLCGLSIMNMNMLWCYSSTDSWIDRTETIALCYFSTNSWIDRSERIALRWLRTLQTIPTFCSLLIWTREWFFAVLWGIIIWSNYVSTIERLH